MALRFFAMLKPKWILLVGLFLLGRAARPVLAQQENLPTTLAEIVTFSMQGDQIVADVHWKPPGQVARLALTDVPGYARVQNIMMPQPNMPQPNGAADDSLMIVITQVNGNVMHTISLMVRPGLISFGDNRRVQVNAAAVRMPVMLDGFQLMFSKDGCTFNRRSFVPGQPMRPQSAITEPTWADFLEKHPDDVDKDIRPLLETLHLESLLGTHDLWAYQVLADRLKPSSDAESQVKPLIEQFDDPLPEKRDEASDKLKKLGNPALAVMAHLDRKQLTPEQAARIEQISPGGFLDDQRVAALKADKKFLLDCLQSRDEDVRRATAAQLQAVLGAAIDFDPAGQAAARGAQIRKLRQLICPTTQPTTQP